MATQLLTRQEGNTTVLEGVVEIVPEPAGLTLEQLFHAVKLVTSMAPQGAVRFNVGAPPEAPPISEPAVAKEVTGVVLEQAVDPVGSILAVVEELAAAPRRWTKHTPFRFGGMTVVVHPQDHGAIPPDARMCLDGMAQLATSSVASYSDNPGRWHDLYRKASACLDEGAHTFGFGDRITLNDHPMTTIADVRECVRRARIIWSSR